MQAAVLKRDATAIRNAMLSRELARVRHRNRQKAGLYPTLIQVSSSFGDQRSTFAAGDLSGEGPESQSGGQPDGELQCIQWRGDPSTRHPTGQNRSGGGSDLDFADQQSQMVVFARTAVDRMNAQESIYGLAVRMADNARSLLNMGADRFEFGAINSLDFRELQLGVQRAEMEVLRTQQEWGSAHLDLNRLQGFWSGGVDTE